MIIFCWLYLKYYLLWEILSSCSQSSPCLSHLAVSPHHAFGFLKNIKENLEGLGEQVTGIHERQPDAIRDSSPAEVAQIGDSLTQLNAEWDRLNRMYNHRKGYTGPPFIPFNTTKISLYIHSSARGRVQMKLNRRECVCQDAQTH